ncbi:MAG TPA: hypothetical protein VNB23_09345 [Ramlibacter sp.]|nr:hypothetical protein [Ramlibacter sp.]
MRFQPDNLLETLLRPLVMAAPDANVYVEIMAPDFRFAFALLLLVLLGVLSLRRRQAAGEAPLPSGRRAVFVLLAVLAVAFVPWLATSANGRYFVVGLLLVGPVCVGLAALLPVTRSLRLTLALGMVAWQAFAVYQSAPWKSWGVAEWTEPPYFQFEVPAEWRAQPATLVTMSAISYSLAAPMFHPEARWISLHNAPAPDGPLAGGRRTAAFLAAAQPGRLLLFVPALPDAMTPERLPDDKVMAVLDAQLAPFRLAFARPHACRFLPSRTLAGMGLGQRTQAEKARAGFWLCHLAAGVASPASVAAAVRGSRHDAVFGVLEAQCPRFFPRGGDGPGVALPNGTVRSYQQGEMKAYVYDGGEVYYKYYRALNPVLVGKADAILAGQARLDCGNIRGRAGLPWQREI